MLVLSRRLNEKVLLPTVGAAIQVLGIKGGCVRLGIQAPPDVVVLREELAGSQAAPRPSAAVDIPAPAIRDMVQNRLRILAQGLAELRRQLDADQSESAAITLDKLEEDLEMLRHRLEAEKQPTATRPSTPSRPRQVPAPVARREPAGELCCV